MSTNTRIDIGGAMTSAQFNKIREVISLTAGDEDFDYSWETKIEGTSFEFELTNFNAARIDTITGLIEDSGCTYKKTTQKSSEELQYIVWKKGGEIIKYKSINENPLILISEIDSLLAVGLFEDRLIEIARAEKSLPKFTIADSARERIAHKITI